MTQTQMLLCVLPAVQGMEKRAFQGLSDWQDNNPGKALGASLLIPGVGSGMMLNDAGTSLRNGKYWSAAGNLVGAGLSAVPFVGNAMARGGKALLGSGKALAKHAPTLTGAVSKMPGMDRLRSGFNSGMGQAHQFMQKPVMQNSYQWMKKHPKTTAVGGMALGTGIGSFQDSDPEPMSHMDSLGISNMLRGVQSNFQSANPIWMRS